ncbi:MAG: nitroreductase [Ramlibacter sp.]
MAAPAATALPAEPGACAQWTWALIQHRQTILPKKLTEPGPDEGQLDLILRAAAAAPDHREILPWRFVIIPAATRGRLAEVFGNALRERDPAATARQVEEARGKAFRSPVLMLAVVRTGSPHEEVPAGERLLSAGCAVQNMLLMATAMGFASALTSGKALQSAGMRALFSLARDEQAVCFVSLGSAVRSKSSRQRPEPGLYVSYLSTDP